MYAGQYVHTVMVYGGQYVHTVRVYAGQYVHTVRVYGGQYVHTVWVVQTTATHGLAPAAHNCLGWQGLTRTSPKGFKTYKAEEQKRDISVTN